MSARRSPRAWLAAVLLAAALAGCGHVTSVGSDATLQLALSEYRMTPQDVRAPAGTLTIVVHNDGRLTHDLLISHNGYTEASTAPIPPGQSVEVEASLTPGQYLMASSLQSDQALGAYGTLNVR